MESRIKMLREKRGLIQKLLAVEIGVTQQMLSKYEKDITIIKCKVSEWIASQAAFIQALFRDISWES